MTTPYNGWASVLTVQGEDSFNASSAQTIYSLIGKTRFTQAPVIGGKGQIIDVWRNQSKNFFNTKHYQGTIEFEFGFNAVTLLFIQTFLHIFSQAATSTHIETEAGFDLMTEDDSSLRTEGADVDAIQYHIRPPRLQAVKSLKIGLEYNPGGRYFVFSGVVIDSMRIDIRRAQSSPKVTIQFKAASLTEVFSPNVLGTPVVVVDKNPTNHLQCSATLDSAPIQLFTEANFTFSNPKTPVAFDKNGNASRFSQEQGFTIKGEIAEYYNPSSVLADYFKDQADHSLFLKLLDPAETQRRIEITLPRVNFESGSPDGIAAGDLTYRGSFIGLQDSALNTSSEPNIFLVI